jgi:hypothetical protein
MSLADGRGLLSAVQFSRSMKGLLARLHTIARWSITLTVSCWACTTGPAKVADAGRRAGAGNAEGATTPSRDRETGATMTNRMHPRRGAPAVPIVPWRGALISDYVHACSAKVPGATDSSPWCGFVSLDWSEEASSCGLRT